MKKLSILLLSLLCFATYAQVLSAKFDTKNHPKAKGVWATVRYPAEWQPQEGERPNIVQKFAGNYRGLLTILTFQIVDVGQPVEKECNEMSASDYAQAFTDKPNKQFALNVKKTKHEQKPAFIFEAQSKQDRAGLSFNTTSKVMTVCYKNTMISLSCFPSLIESSKSSMSSTRKELDLAAPLCFEYFNSLVLMDKY
jgi:hypothetical protein